MLRANLLNTYNNSVEKNELDKFLEEFGGTSYVKAYSSSCETYRSLGMVSYGKIPKYTKINSRNILFEWDSNCLGNILESSKYKTKVIGDSLGVETGVYNCFSKDKLKIDYENNPLEFVVENINKMKQEEKSCIFLCLELPHQIRDDYYFDGKFAGKIIVNEVAKTLKTLFDKIDKDSFDNILIFSDHGYKDDFLPNLELINDDRAKIFLHTRKKNQVLLEKKLELRHITDIYSTLLEYSEIENKGKKLSDSEGHEFIVIEDYKNWEKNSIDYIEEENIWGVRSDKYFYITDLVNEKLYFEKEVGIYEEQKIKDIMRDQFIQILEKNTLKFKKRKNSLNLEKIQNKNIQNKKYILNSIRPKNNREKLKKYLEIEGSYNTLKLLLNRIFKINGLK